MRATRTIWLVNLLTMLGLLAGLPVPAFAQSAVVQWAGVLEFIDTDSETGALTGGTPGVSPFEGYFVHPVSCGAGCLVEPFPPDATNYVFAGGTGLIKGLGVSIPGDESSIEIIDDEVLDEEGVAFADLFGITVTVGQTVDTWVLASQNDAEFTPAFVDWGLSFLYVTTDPFSSTAFVAAPPPNPDLVIFEVYEDEGDVYAAVGTGSVVPEPGFGTLVAMGGMGLALAVRRRGRIG